MQSMVEGWLPKFPRFRLETAQACALSPLHHPSGGPPPHGAAMGRQGQNLVPTLTPTSLGRMT